MIKILKKIGIKTRLDVLLLCGIILTGGFVVVFKIFPDKFGIDWTKNKREINNDISIFQDQSGNFIPKSEGKKKYFKSLGKSDEQIFADEIATYYLRGAWVLPQFFPAFFNSTVVGGAYNACLASTYVITHAIKKIVHKKRPDGGNYKSFPSGHTSGTSVLAGFVHKFYGIKMGFPLYIFSAATGGSRVFSNRHDIYDVVGGFFVGGFCGFYTNSVIIFIANFVAKRSKTVNKLKDFLLTEL